MKKHAYIIKIAAICVLLVILVCLSLMYMNSYRSVKVASFTADMDRAVRATRYKETYVNLISDSLVSPYFVAFSSDGKKAGFFGDEAYGYYKEIEDVVSALIGPDAHIYESEEAAMRYLASNNYIYIRYRYELPMSIIYYMQNPDRIINDANDDEYVYDMFIVPTNTGAYAVMRDMRGNYRLCYSEETVRINKSNYLPYNVFDGGLEFEFAFEKDIDNALISTGFNEKINVFELFFKTDITVSSAVVETDAALDDAAADNALLAFGLNPEKVSRHESDDGVTYYDEGANVRITNDGFIAYSALSLQYGISLSQTIGYDFSGEGYSLMDCTGAALVLARALGLYDDSDFMFALTCVEMDGETAIIELSYTYDGITVMPDNNYAIRIEITDGHIMSLMCSFAKAHLYSGQTTYTQNEWKTRAAVINSDGPIDISYVHKIKNGRLYLTTVAFSKEDAE